MSVKSWGGVVFVKRGCLERHFFHLCLVPPAWPVATYLIPTYTREKVWASFWLRLFSIIFVLFIQLISCTLVYIVRTNSSALGAYLYHRAKDKIATFFPPRLLLTFLTSSSYWKNRMYLNYSSLCCYRRQWPILAVN